MVTVFARNSEILRLFATKEFWGDKEQNANQQNTETYLHILRFEFWECSNIKTKWLNEK